MLPALPRPCPVARRTSAGVSLIHGVTLIELVMVIVLLGILSASATGLFASRSSYAAALIRDQILGELRLAQQVALMRQSTSTVSVELRESNDTT